MKVEVSNFGGITVVRLCGPRLDAAQSVRFKEALRDISDRGADHILLDMSCIQFMDSSGLGAIVTVLKQMGQAKTLELAALSPIVAKVFALTRMDQIFQLHQTVDGALSSGAKAVG
ncbi:STAS domain-containing protein [Neptunicoccus cionae]|uniref:Anti-sigma factor antagonist n=1 Tax=Neptunicoccus cionae TaxID=2035344 RepID=A0A916QX25_9RHOB|nr:STAS domain-containing protein [Amylibacter cionae]GGA16525.1 anti-sigma factor antagonist [Amylibacter cionae]